ncbi:hypothetical protein HAX54_007687 [Datura stramonium]|uniref:Uncharacterized protein n=1 Tax=Datura stramonium TaxID=4076 RepID=A0ABS8WYW9_DATST|nr:hypothetical protein [Datura stramonium]
MPFWKKSSTEEKPVTRAYSNRWQSGYYAYEIDSDCGTMELPALIHVRAYLYAGTSRSINRKKDPRFETRSACSYKAHNGSSPTLLPIRVIFLTVPRACFRKHFGHSKWLLDKGLVVFEHRISSTSQGERLPSQAYHRQSKERTGRKRANQILSLLSPEATKFIPAPYELIVAKRKKRLIPSFPGETELK